MTEIQNPKQLAFDLIWDLDIEIWNLFGPILRSGGACNLLFPVYPDLDPKPDKPELNIQYSFDNIQSFKGLSFFRDYFFFQL
jgi:hypothetical protein